MTEATLSRNFKQHLPRLIPAQGRRGNSRLVVAEEFACGEGIADLVVGWLADADSANWSPDGWTVLQSVTGAVVFRCLNKRVPVSSQEIARHVGVTPRTVCRYMDELVHVGLAARRTGGFVRCYSARDIPEAEIWAFEAKLFDWRRAMNQALRYRGFANYSVVVMPESCVNGALRSKRLFQQFGVGLLTVADAKSASFVIRPRRRRPRSAAIHLAAVARLARSCEPLS